MPGVVLPREQAWGLSAWHLYTLRVANRDSLQAHLTAQGLAPGVAVHVLQRAPTWVIEVGETTIALERRVAEGIRLAPGGARGGRTLPRPGEPV